MRHPSGHYPQGGSILTFASFSSHLAKRHPLSRVREEGKDKSLVNITVSFVSPWVGSLFTHNVSYPTFVGIKVLSDMSDNLDIMCQPHDS